MHAHFKPARRLQGLGLAALTAATLAACGGGDYATLDLNLTGLEDLGANAVYEGWLIVNGAPVTTGRFSVDSSGRLSRSSFTVTEAQANLATAFVLTIEPAVNDVPAPTDTHLVAGDFNAAKTSATVSIGHAAALGNDFSSAAGTFILATPSSPSTSDENQGIWWLSTASGTPQASLSLPTLPAGWVYEGWAVVNGTAHTTGRFTSVSGADSDGAGPTAGPNATPPFPGQDFITPPVVLPGGTAVITIEPVVDNSPAPFTLKPLVGTIGTGVGPSISHAMTNNAANGVPGGTVTLTR